MGVIRVYSAEEAKGSVLRRAPWEEQTMPAGLIQAIGAHLRGALTPDEAVRAILADVRDRGDAASGSGSQRLDGARPAELRDPAGRLASRIRGVALIAAARPSTSPPVGSRRSREAAQRFLGDAGADGWSGSSCARWRASASTSPGHGPLPSSLLMRRSRRASPACARSSAVRRRAETGE